MNEQRFRIITLNTWKCDGDYRKRLDWMAEGLIALRPDIILLQEAFQCSKTGDDTAKYLGDSLNKQVVEQSGRSKTRNFLGKMRLSNSNLAILLPLGLEYSRSDFALEPIEEDRHRTILRVDAFLNRIPVRLCNTHFTHIRSRAGDLVRRKQSEQLVEASYPVDDGISVYGGDLNAVWEDAALDPLRGVEGRSTPEEYSVSGTMIGQKRDTFHKSHTIDFLMVRTKPNNKKVRLERVYSALTNVFDESDSHASDHAAVVAEIVIRESDG